MLRRHPKLSNPALLAARERAARFPKERQPYLVCPSADGVAMPGVHSHEAIERAERALAALAAEERVGGVATGAGLLRYLQG